MNRTDSCLGFGFGFGSDFAVAADELFLKVVDNTTHWHSFETIIASIDGKYLMCNPFVT
jgi:hypothetical protein